MMSGYSFDRCGAAASWPRRYAVIPRAGGWSVSLNGACTRPFADKDAAERIAAQLQRQRDRLNQTRGRTVRVTISPEFI